MKRFLIVGLILVFFGVLFSAIGAGSLSVDARRGLAWYFTNDHTKLYAEWEPQLIAYIEAQGLEWNKQRIEANAAHRADVVAIVAALRGATPEQLAAIKTALGL
jgi:hypothetical protein